MLTDWQKLSEAQVEAGEARSMLRLYGSWVEDHGGDENARATVLASEAVCCELRALTIAAQQVAMQLARAPGLLRG